MANFEQIDDYLSNRLQEQDRKAFEQQLEGDPSLKEEVEFQRQIIEGVRHARMAELKTMLNNVPVSGGSTWGGAKIAAAVVSAGIISALIYLNVSEEKTASQEATKEPVTEVVTTPEQNSAASSETPAEVTDNNTKEITTEPTDRSTAKEPVKKTADETNVTTPVHKPDINVVDPSNELSADEKKSETEVSTAGRSEISPSKMEVITGVEDKKHNFHYQFAQGKLMLYGPFDKSLYEILEIHGDRHAVFLFYRENYYLLDESQTKITQLQAIRDSDLLRKLKEYRGR
ncbi:MAG TPA: hypothetical protein VG737_14005 [Cyclobacteriaceae bacterium]|nr:hypothetical protein [Cyclobacteriaceae bacterium]